MIEEFTLGNSNTLIFLDKNKSQCVDDFHQIQRRPDVVMISSWEKDLSGYQQIKALIEKLIDMGCKYFVCVGAYSEKLHDFIDDVLLDRSINSQFEDSDVMTTWHDTETVEEVAEFFLYSTNASNCLLMVFLEQGRREDDELKKALLNLVLG